MWAKRTSADRGSGGGNSDLYLQLPDVLPRVVWIELTSKCPLDCVFCTRKRERGAGEHMRFDLYESLIGQLKTPEIIRLNYSGESLHYPRLADAIRLARTTGATTELVTALGSAPRRVIEDVVDAGLHRLSISLHTLDAARYTSIYGTGSVSAVRDRLDYLREYQARRGCDRPEIDFAFVATDDNLADLRAVAGYASAMGAKHLSVHPVIRRSAPPSAFTRELDPSGEPRADFCARIAREVEAARSAAEGLTIGVARPMPKPEMVNSGWITTCEQNPWNTIHILADGSVVPCEAQDKTVLGNLRRQSLHDIWNGEPYLDLRRRYVDGSHGPCRRCPWRITAGHTSARQVPLWGWHPSSRDPAPWSERSAALAMLIPPAVERVAVTGLLPPGSRGGNTLSIALGPFGRATVTNSTGELLPFEAVLPAPALPVQSPSVMTFNAGEPFCPAERDAGPDLRRLGFAMTGLSFVYDRRRVRNVGRVLRVLEQLEKVSRFKGLRAASLSPRARGNRGVSILVPARGMPDLLGPTLEFAEAALKPLDEPSEIVVVASETNGSDYAPLVRRLPRIRWVFRNQALHYVAAVRLGLRYTAFPWVYLLNSDMHLEPDAIAAVLPLRQPRTFAVGSRIVMADGTATETNWTDLRLCGQDAAQIVERQPDGLDGARGCLYVGGGSGLFRSSLLKRVIRATQAYAPFYWEDVEWGTRAWLHGYESVFCPRSRAVHAHRQTIRRYYEEPEVSRIFERNRLMFHMRNLPGVHVLHGRMLELDERTWSEIFNPAALARIAIARARAFLSPQSSAVLQNRWTLRF